MLICKLLSTFNFIVTSYFFADSDSEPEVVYSKAVKPLPGNIQHIFQTTIGLQC